jgi:hypothetical protein
MSMTKLTAKHERMVGIVLALLMLATRWRHFGDALHLPDASLAIFFIAGFFVSGALAFGVLLFEAGIIDWAATSAGGVSDWCLSPAYWFLIPTYGVLWGAGRWYARVHRTRVSTLIPLCGALFTSTSIAFLISNGSFYALSGRFTDMGWTEYAARTAQYFPPYQMSAFVYVASAAVVYALLLAWRVERPRHDRIRT